MVNTVLRNVVVVVRTRRKTREKYGYILRVIYKDILEKDGETKYARNIKTIDL